MQIAIIGLGRMGGNMARRLLRKGIEVVGYNRSPEVTATLQREEGLLPADSLHEAVEQLSAPRIVWLMLPAGNATEQTLHELIPMLAEGDIIVDGGNANYHDSMRRAAELQTHGIGFIDAGTSGGVWGLENGYCMMVGGSEQDVARLEPVLKALAPAEDRGWARMGPVGAGHYTKMVHNGIEYGMMQAFAEGFDLMRSKREFDLDLARVAETWRHSSVVRSWLLDLTADALSKEPDMAAIAPVVPDSGEGRWTVVEAVDQGVSLPVITLALQARFASQDEEGYQARLLSVMRNAFGGHDVVKR
ncbi:MAG: decarboxylating 6-phosphogluconate dehydrogenase [Gammaproteobacteria bacterium]|nr:decarboxylating 6-phosphogluconate dehydrogenase [Gammaproteobacteria bacterium]MCW8840907.1 decarboxylating 6-phosphogluconate dehydrogenase [Gammaproteobacteria bacterium]MCW8927402.1 decarboxylating 6-phosphogluconate dehydrogenase [Gammaproteobacteria bacterium]MCW8957937.1 decarboxylating 6-phosphogluconate dehydrogenase [Gammaproteobacteria bacterium]MCW8972123.1 decarboxylating 6-phosphogluconate dehydrogenase [Gammaproteobacteria bacterium]